MDTLGQVNVETRRAAYYYNLTYADLGDMVKQFDCYGESPTLID